MHKCCTTVQQEAQYTEENETGGLVEVEKEWGIFGDNLNVDTTNILSECT